MKTWEIWCEGCPPKSGKEIEQAWLVPFGEDVRRADSFKDACDRAFAAEQYYDSKTTTLSGFKLFDNETDARKRFG
jgi:hypothetical protein